MLSDPPRRAVYDQYGEEGLKNGVPGAEGSAKPYVYHGDPMQTFRWNKNYTAVELFAIVQLQRFDELNRTFPLLMWTLRRSMSIDIYGVWFFFSVRNFYIFFDRIFYYDTCSPSA